MNSSSLNPLQMIGVSPPLVIARTASSSGFDPASRPNLNGLPKSSLNDVPLLIDFDRVDATVVALVASLGDRGAEGVGDFGDSVRMSANRIRMGTL